MEKWDFNKTVQSILLNAFKIEEAEKIFYKKPK